MLRAGNETVSSRKKARRDETVSISSRLVTCRLDLVSSRDFRLVTGPRHALQFEKTLFSVSLCGAKVHRKKDIKCVHKNAWLVFRQYVPIRSKKGESGDIKL